MTGNRDVAQAFSRHRFEEVYPRLAPDVRWVLVGSTTLTGSEEVVRTCEESARELAEVTTEFSRFLTVGEGDLVAVDAIGHYRAPDGSTSVVSSCDIYEFAEDELVAITSYTVELEDTEP